MFEHVAKFSYRAAPKKRHNVASGDLRTCNLTDGWAWREEAHLSTLHRAFPLLMHHLRSTNQNRLSFTTRAGKLHPTHTVKPG